MQAIHLVRLCALAVCCSSFCAAVSAQCQGGRSSFPAQFGTFSPAQFGAFTPQLGGFSPVAQSGACWARPQLDIFSSLPRQSFPVFSPFAAQSSLQPSLAAQSEQLRRAYEPQAYVRQQRLEQQFAQQQIKQARLERRRETHRKRREEELERRRQRREDANARRLARIESSETNPDKSIRPVLSSKR